MTEEAYIRKLAEAANKGKSSNPPRNKQTGLNPQKR
jgi:hypothetical protein